MLVIVLCRFRVSVVNHFESKLKFLQNLLRQWWTTSPERKAAIEAVLWRCSKNLSDSILNAIAACFLPKIAVEFFHQSRENCQSSAPKLRLVQALSIQALIQLAKRESFNG